MWEVANGLDNGKESAMSGSWPWRGCQVRLILASRGCPSLEAPQFLQ